MLDFVPAKAATAMAHFKFAAITTKYFEVNKWRPFLSDKGRRNNALTVSRDDREFYHAVIVLGE